MARTPYWTALARQAFASLAARGKVSLRDLMGDLGLAGKAAQSGLVRALGRWARAGWVRIDSGAPRNFARYTLTPGGRRAWEGAVAAARARFQGFLEVQKSLIQGHPPDAINAPPNLPPARTPQAPSRRVFTCPRCATATPVETLREQLRQTNAFACEACGQVLTDAAREYLDQVHQQ